MNKWIIIIAACMISVSGFSQELSRKEERRLMKELKKEEEARELDRKSEIVGWMVENRQFVLEADRLRDKYGNTANVASSINFLASDSTAGVIQIGSDRYLGYNGVGGITVDGRVTSYEFSKNEKHNTYNVQYHLGSTTGTYTVNMVVFPDGRAQATVSSNWPGKLNYLGYLVPPSASRVYKGTSLY